MLNVENQQDNRYLSVNIDDVVEINFLAEFNIEWIEIFRKSKVSFVNPIIHGMKSIDFNPMLKNEFPELGVYKVKKGWVLGENGWVFSENGNFLNINTWYGKEINEIQDKIQKFSVIEKKGTCLVLSSDWSNVNYGHFLLDGICRFELFNQSKIDISDIDYFYCSTQNANYKRIVQKLGISLKRCIEPQKNVALQFDQLIAPSFPGIRRIYPTWAVQFLKREFLLNQPKPFRKIYIPRNTSRKIINEMSLIKILERFDFEIFYPHDCENSPKYFSESRIIISAHGAALTDIAFCSSGTKVLELIPSDHVYPYWYSLANAAGLEYHCIVGESFTNGLITDYGPSPYDFFIDVNVFEKTIKGIIL